MWKCPLKSSRLAVLLYKVACVLLLFFPGSLIISGFLFFHFTYIRMLISPLHEQLRRLLIHRASSFLLHCYDVFILFHTAE